MGLKGFATGVVVGIVLRAPLAGVAWECYRQARTDLHRLAAETAAGAPAAPVAILEPVAPEEMPPVPPRVLPEAEPPLDASPWRDVPEAPRRLDWTGRTP